MKGETKVERDVNKAKAVIVGLGISKFGRSGDNSYVDIGREAVRMAFEDAHVGIKDIGVAFCSNCYLPIATGLRVLSTFGRRGIPTTDVDAACAAGIASLKLAKLSIESGECDIALAFGVEKMPSGFMDPTTIYPKWQCYLGLSQNPMYWALRAKRHMHDYGTTVEQMAKVSVKNHKNGALNPYAMYQKPMSIEEILNSKVVNDPLTLFMLCAPNEGAAAVVLCNEEIADKHTDKPIQILSCVQSSSKFPQLHGPAFCATPTDNPSAHEMTAQEAYKVAGIGPEDIDLAEVQDGDAFSEIALYEYLGFCERGEGGKLIDEGATEIGGRIPVNVSGGLIAKGEPVGASHLGQIFELGTQLREEAGERQVRGAEIGLAHVYGINGNCGVTILGLSE